MYSLPDEPGLFLEPLVGRPQIIPPRVDQLTTDDVEIAGHLGRRTVTASMFHGQFVTRLPRFSSMPHHHIQIPPHDSRQCIDPALGVLGLLSKRRTIEVPYI